MLKRLSLEQIAENMNSGAPIEEKIRQGVPLTREEELRGSRLRFNMDELRLALLEQGAGFAPLALETGANFVDGGSGVVGSGIVLFVKDSEVAGRFGIETTDKAVPLATLIPAFLSMTPEATEDDRRRHAKSQADLTALSDVEKQLREHNKRWFSLGDGWHFRKSTEEVTVWLNPANQEEDQYGWYTIEELRQWVEDNGPVKNVRSHKSPV